MTERQFADKCLQQIEEVLMYEGAHNVAAFMLETVTGTNGIIIPPGNFFLFGKHFETHSFWCFVSLDGYLQGVREICNKHGIVLICDEVMAGLGRTGEWFACDNWKGRRCKRKGIFFVSILTSISQLNVQFSC